MVVNFGKGNYRRARYAFAPIELFTSYKLIFLGYEDVGQIKSGRITPYATALSYKQILF